MFPGIGFLLDFGHPWYDVGRISAWLQQVKMNVLVMFLVRVADQRMHLSEVWEDLLTTSRV